MRYDRSSKNFDYVLFILVCLLAVFGIIAITSAMESVATNQKLFFVTGIVLMLAVAFIDYRFICKFYIVAYVLNLILLVAVFHLSSDASEATNTARWIAVGSFSIQPSEFSKLFMIIFLSTLIDKYIDRINSIFMIIGIAILVVIPVILIVMQPSLSASLVNVAIFICIIFIAGLDYKYIMAVLGVGIPAITFFYYDLVYNGLGFIMKITGGILKPYHFGRILAFIEKDPKDDLYRQTHDSIVAISTGAFSGKGLEQGEMNKLNYIDNNENDFIFSVIGEELGFIGCIIAITLMFLIIVKLVLIANRSTTSQLGKLIITGVIGMFAFQSIINVAVATGLMVNTGMPFPFLSQGGSSLWVNMMCIGLVINVGMERPKSMFEG